MIRPFIAYSIVAYLLLSLPFIFGLGYEIDWIAGASLLQKLKGYILTGLTYGYMWKLIASIVVGMVGSSLKFSKLNG
ncbi:hypothetical protein [Pseudalkalibacillus sp. SCS-8]|uniref:hypothetical protein n=1 Tax=Pseudalkalibacillus nanhaiensis TaxID=3115291 RepID=UPI0032DA313B